MLIWRRIEVRARRYRWKYSSYTDMGPSRSRSIPAFFKIVPDFTKSKVHAIIPAVRECTVGPSRASFWRNSSVEDSLIRTIMKIRKHTSWYHRIVGEGKLKKWKVNHWLRVHVIRLFLCQMSEIEQLQALRIPSIWEFARSRRTTCCARVSRTTTLSVKRSTTARWRRSRGACVDYSCCLGCRAWWAWYSTRRRCTRCSALRNRDCSRSRASISFCWHNLIRSGTERIVCHTVRCIIVVMIGCCDRPTWSFILTDGPILQIVVAAVNKAYLVIAPVTIQSPHIGAIIARVVCPVVLQNLSGVSLLLCPKSKLLIDRSMYRVRMRIIWRHT